MWFSVFMLVIVFVLLYLPFSLFWGWTYASSGFKLLLKHLVFWIVPIIIIHEGLHGVIWALSLKKGFTQIKFGFNREMLAPYTHCLVPLYKNSYLAGGLAPLALMGIIPSIICFFSGNSYWYSLSLVCIWTSAGDILSCYFLLRVPQGYKIQDHPKKLGFILIPI